MSKFEQFLAEPNEQKGKSNELDAPKRIQMFQKYIEEEVKKQEGQDMTEQVISGIQKLNKEIEESHLVDNTNSILSYRYVHNNGCKCI